MALPMTIIEGHVLYHDLEMTHCYIDKNVYGLSEWTFEEYIYL